MVIGVVFDGAIVENNYPDLGKERPFAFLALQELKLRGHEIFLLTHRTGNKLQIAIELCQKEMVEFDGIIQTDNNGNPPKTLNKTIDTYIDSQKMEKIASWLEIFWELNPQELDSVKLIKKRKNRKFNKWMIWKKFF